jgi:pilus assembly protein CpaD
MTVRAIPTLILGLLLPAALAACGHDQAENTYFPPRHGYIDQPPRNQASLTTLSHRVPLDRVQTRLTRPQIESLNGFLVASGESDGDHVEIRLALAGAPPRNAAIADDLRRSFLSGGYAPSRVRVVETPGAADAVEVAILRYAVVLPDCSTEVRRPPGMHSWSDEPVGMRQFGCNNERNLGLMIADPRDLTGERETGPSPGYREADSVLRYRTDKVKELKDEMTTKE